MKKSKKGFIMIIYNKGAFGLNLIARFRGSAVYKSITPGIFSVLFFNFLQWIYSGSTDPEDLDHPYVIGVIVTSISFIIIFRTNNAYQRVSKARFAFFFLFRVLTNSNSSLSLHIK